MTHAVSIRPRSWALVVCSLILIALSVRAAIYELTEALEGVSSSDAWLAVGASILSAVVGLVFLAWAARLKPTVLSWLAAFGWGTGGALIFAGYGNTVIDSAVAASNLSDDAVDVVTSVVTGPLVEETGKGIGVLALVLAARKVLDRPAQGGVLGALQQIVLHRDDRLGEVVDLGLLLALVDRPARRQLRTGLHPADRCVRDARHHAGPGDCQ